MIVLEHLARVALRMRAVHETWSAGADEQRRRDDAGNSAIFVWENEGGLIGDQPGHAPADGQEATGTINRSDWSRAAQSRGARGQQGGR